MPRRFLFSLCALMAAAFLCAQPATAADADEDDLDWRSSTPETEEDRTKRIEQKRERMRRLREEQRKEDKRRSELPEEMPPDGLPGKPPPRDPPPRDISRDDAPPDREREPRGGGDGNLWDDVDRAMTVDEAKSAFTKRLERRGNKRLKVGPVTEQDENVLFIDVVTVDDSLVERFTVDRKSGHLQRIDLP